MDPIFKTTGLHVWSSEKNDSVYVWAFDFARGVEFWRRRNSRLFNYSDFRAFAVRSAPKKSADPKAKPKTQKRYTKDADGVITDSRTGLQWYVGSDWDTNWYAAKKWVDGLTVAGGGWRMPSRNELKGLYQKGKGSRNMDPIFKTSDRWVWSGETRGSSDAWRFHFTIGEGFWHRRTPGSDVRAFAVRSRR